MKAKEKAIEKDKLGHPIINGYTIHEIRDDLCIICFKDRVIKEAKKEVLIFIEDWIEEKRKSNDMWRYSVDELFGMLEEDLKKHLEGCE